MSSFKRILPLLNRIVVRKIEPQSKTNSGIILSKPDSQTYGVILEAGPGAHDNLGKVIPLSVKVGDTVMLPEFGGQKVKLGEQELFIFRDTDIIAKMEWFESAFIYFIWFDWFGLYKKNSENKTYLSNRIRILWLGTKDLKGRRLNWNTKDIKLKNCRRKGW